MKSDLHPTTQAVWLTIQRYFDEFGFAPSFREIGRGAFIAESNVRRHLDRLQQLGIIEWWPGQPRSIKLCRRVEEA